MGKVDLNKKQKKTALLDSAFRLFMENGFNKTSISDIVNDAGVAKGTFYLYFQDKYDIRRNLIGHKANQVFWSAYTEMNNQKVTVFEEQVIFIVNHVLDAFSKNKSLVLFISKHLSWGFFKSSLIQSDYGDDKNIYEAYEKLLKASGNTYKNPEIMIYMIIELVGSASYNSILYGEPVAIEVLKPHLYDAIRDIMRRELIDNSSQKD